MSWISTEQRKPKQNQWVVVSWNDIFKCGQFDAKHPFGPCIVDRQSGKYYSGFQNWKPLTAPKVKS